MMNSKLAQFAPRLGVVWTPDAGDRDPRRLGHLLRYAAPLLQHAIRQQSPVGRADHVDESSGRVLRSVPRLSGRQSVPGAGDRLADPAVPGVRRLCQRAARHATHCAAAMEHRRAAAVRRLAGIGQLSWQPLEPSVAGDRAEPGGLLRQAPRPGPPTSVACCILQDPVHGPVLRHDRSTRRHRARQLSRHAAVAAAPAEGQPERALQLHVVEMQERPGDDGADRSDHRRSEQPGPRLLAIAIPIAGTS